MKWADYIEQHRLVVKDYATLLTNATQGSALLPTQEDTVAMAALYDDSMKDFKAMKEYTEAVKRTNGTHMSASACKTERLRKCSRIKALALTASAAQGLSADKGFMKLYQAQADSEMRSI